MAFTPEERIAVEILRRLKTVVVEEDQHTRLAEVYRVNRDATDWTPENNAIVLVQGSASRLPELDCPGNPPANAYQLELAVVGFIRQSDREELADRSEVNQLVALAKRSITPASNWYTFGGICHDAEFGDVTPFVPSNGSLAGASVQLNVAYKVSELDPFLVR